VSSLRIKTALDNVSGNVMMADAEHRIIYLNQSVLNLFQSLHPGAATRIYRASIPASSWARISMCCTAQRRSARLPPICAARSSPNSGSAR
jgi:hypothetical protein